MKPTVGIHPYGLAGEFLEITWLLDGFEQREQAYRVLEGTQSSDPCLFSPWMPMVPRAKRVSFQDGFVYCMNWLL